VLLASFLKIDSISLVGFIGVFSIVLGIISISFNKKDYKNAYLPILVGCSIALYSVTDKLGVNHISPLLFIFLINIGSPLVLIPFIYKGMKPEISLIFKEHKKKALSIGYAGVTAYVLILLAFQHSPASYVVALREISILVAIFLGVFFLKEELSKQRIFGIVLLVLGAILVKLG